MNLSFRKSSDPLPEVPVQVVLASQSLGRRLLLEKLGIPFRVVISRIDEEAIKHPQPIKTVQKRATAKLDDVIGNPRVYNLPAEGKFLIIAADSMGILGKKTFGKSRDREHTKEILKVLMGKTHSFATAVAIGLIDNGKEKKRWEKVVQTRVTLRKMPPTEVESFVTRFDLARFAAGFALNETPWDLVTKIEGSYTNVIGLPFEVLLPVLRLHKIIT
ncbi:Maf family protein [Candidatus Gottesmanbacteria bacterium]|nr:Maf family protein [Candidatus Gottesmanbacteria bacterium]